MASGNWGGPPGGGPPGGGGNNWGGPPGGGGGGGWGSPPGGGGPPGGPPGGGGYGGPPGGGYGGPPGGPPRPAGPPGGGSYAPGPPPPPPGMPPGYNPHNHGSALAGGVPWESETGSFFSKWWETVAAANFKGRQFFSAVGQSQDAMTACVFSAVTSTIFTLIFMAIFGVIFALFFTAIIATLAKSGGGSAAGSVAGMGVAVMALYGVGAVVGSALFGFIGPWIVGGLHHLVLMMASGVGSGRGYADSVRVNAYASAASMLFIPAAIIPVIGSLVYLVFNAINHVTGYDMVHNCGGGKAFLAWISPVFLWCCCQCMVWTMLGGMM